MQLIPAHHTSMGGASNSLVLAAHHVRSNGERDSHVERALGALHLQVNDVIRKVQDSGINAGLLIAHDNDSAA